MVNPGSRLKAQGSTFNIQHSTINIQQSTFSDQHSAINIQNHPSSPHTQFSCISASGPVSDGHRRAAPFLHT